MTCISVSQNAKRLFIFVLCVVAIVTTKANPVSRNEALQKARYFMPSKHFQEGKKLARTQALSVNDPFYVFNDEKGHGFVIVSGDDRTEPILGYSDQGNIDLDNIPVNLHNWLEGYAEQIYSLDQEGAVAITNNRAGVGKQAIAPLIQTTWNQSLPYSMMTPTYTNNQGEETHYMTGCVATAIAQVMYFHQWPQSCPAIPEYTSATQHIFRPELPATTFDWNLMKKSYKYDGTGDSAEAVAKLMAYVGQAIEMDYDVDGSSASVRLNVMTNLFSYTKNAYRASRDNYPTAQWEDLIYNELSNNRPVLYDGQSEKSGHQFVCDGYDGNGFFHFNWGWGGGSDGYFVLSLANPSQKGVGEDTGTGGYAYGQSAIIGFQPGSVNEPELPFFKVSISNMVEKNYSRSAANVDFEKVSTKGCYMYVGYNYTPTTTCDIELGWALSQDGELKDIIAYKQQTIDCRDLKPFYLRSYSVPDPISFGAGLPDGNYKLLIVYRYLGESDWKIASYKQCIYAQIADNQLSVRGYKDDVSYTVNSIDYYGEMAQDTEVKVVINVTNTCDAMQETAFFWTKQDGSWLLMGQGIGCFEPGQTGDINIAFTPETPGTFDVKITSDAKGKNVMGTYHITIYAVVKTEYNDLWFACNQGNKHATLIGDEYSSKGWKTLEIPSTVNVDGTDYTITKIEDDAFWNVYSLQKVVLPEGLESIGNSAFAYCYGLQEVRLPSTLNAIGDYAFNNCTNLKTVVSNMTDPCAISRNVFLNTQWTNDGTSYVFTSATLYTPIGSKSNYLSAPVWNEFQKIYQGEYKEVTIDGITYSYATGENFAKIISCDKESIKEDLIIPSTIVIEGKTYQVKAIENRAFLQCKIKSVTIESGIEEIGESAFWNSNSLQKVVLPEGLESIANSAFAYCYRLQEIQLPSTLNAIGDYAFYTCSQLKTVVSNMTDPCAINRNVFLTQKWVNNETVDVFTSAMLSVPSGTESNYISAEGWKEFSTINDIPLGIHSIEPNEKDVRIFDTLGRRLNHPRKGINIVRMSDGTAKKVMIK